MQNSHNNNFPFWKKILSQLCDTRIFIKKGRQDGIGRGAGEDFVQAMAIFFKLSWAK